MQPNEDHWDQCFSKLLKDQSEEEKALWVTEAVIIGRLSAISQLDSTMRNGGSLIEAFRKLKLDIKTEFVTGALDTSDWPKELLRGLNTEEG
jgi:hypothetical protein